MSKSVKNIVGINENIAKLAKKKIVVSDADLSIADALFALTETCVKRGYRDLDGIIEKPAEAFIYNAQVAALMKNFPNAVALLSSLNHDDNYGFVGIDGKVSRTGMMGDIDPIMEVKQMVVAYSGTQHKGPKLFTSEAAWDAHKREERNKEWERKYGSGSTSTPLYNYNRIR